MERKDQANDEKNATTTPEFYKISKAMLLAHQCFIILMGVTR